MNVTVSGSGGNGCLHAWIGDGTFDEAEHIINAVTSGTGTYSFDVPDGAFPGSGPNLTFPACPASNLTAFYGTSLDGEVEDYSWGFVPKALRIRSFSAENTAQTGLVLAVIGMVMGNVRLGLDVDVRRKQAGY